MKIKHKIILWFSSLVAGSLLLFSVYVYFTYSSLRQRAMDGWLERKARVTEQLITKDDAVVGKITTSLPEQVVFIYSPKDSLIFASEVTNDFLASQAFRKRVRDERLVRFSYQSPHHKYPKDGMALTYPGPWPSPSGQEYLVLVTAYDEDGYNRQSNLMDLLILGDIFAIVLVGLLGYFFSRQALKPLHRLIDQLPQEGSLGFRLQPENPNDEVGVLASAFNELLQRQEKLVDNQRAFISQASHELRTPLTTIKGWLETSLTYDSNVQELKKGISQAVRELDKLTALSNGLLQLAQLDNVQVKIDKQPLDVVELVLEVADLLGQQKPGHTLSVNVSQDVLEQATPLLILGNPYLLRTALYNLLDNAVKYSQGQPVSFSLEITQDHQAHIRILDQGIGLTPGEEERILQPLVRGSNVQRIEGFGVGLTLTHRIVLLHQGQLTLSPRESGGTCAAVRLPLYT